MPVVEFLSPNHNRGAFDCGSEPLNRFLREVARQNADRNLGVTHVVVPESGSTEVMGYFTLATSTVKPQEVADRKLPQADIGVVLLGRLAVDRNYQGMGLGKRMLLRSMAETVAVARRIGSYALVLDAIDDDALNWYLGMNLGFKVSEDKPRRLYISVNVLRKIDLGDLSSDI